MDILILHQGEQLGPFTEEAVQGMLKEGKVHINDPAWRKGMKEWAPLVQVLYPAASAESTPSASPEAEPGEPATERQKAFLAFVGVPFSPALKQDEAAQLVNNALENPSDPARLARWNEERLQLHPELFAAEIQARKENRAQHFFEICQQAGAGLFEKVTKAHCQVLVAHLDVHAPNWDAHGAGATWKHFFPALAEKFPQVVTEEGRQRLKEAEQHARPGRGGSTSPAVGGGRPALVSRTNRKLRAVIRGIVWGLVILGGLWMGRGYFEKPAPVEAPAIEPVMAKPLVADAPATPTPAPVIAAAEPSPRPAATPALIAAVEIPEPAPAVAATAIPALPAAPALESPVKMDALAPAVPAAPPAPVDLFSAPPVRSSVTLTKPVEVALTYGKVVVPAGTSLMLVTRNGPTLSLRYLDKVIEVPASSTDIEADGGPVAVVTPAAQ